MKASVFIQTNHKQITGALVAEHALRRYSNNNDKFEEGQVVDAFWPDENPAMRGWYPGSVSKVNARSGVATCCSASSMALLPAKMRSSSIAPAPVAEIINAHTRRNRSSRKSYL